MDEFTLIERYCKPLASGFPGSLNVTDDAAVFSIPPWRELVTTTDAINAGVHFLGSEDPALIAKKLLRVNLSDLAAMGAVPLAYLLALSLPKLTSEDWVKRFAEGLAEDQETFSIPLAGGDTTSTKGTMSFCVTALGTVAMGKALRRNAAQPGDGVYVSGTLGDSALGLRSLQGELSLTNEEDKTFLEQRYFLPEPRMLLGQKLIGIAHACMDVSDGLAQDLGHLCHESGVGAVIRRPSLPLSAAAKTLVSATAALWDSVLGGGDDYELLFTAPVEKEEAIATLSAELALPLTRIGQMTQGSGVQLLDEAGNTLSIAQPGFMHF